MKKIIPLIVGTVALTCINASAVLLAEWTFESPTTPADLTNSATGPTVAASSGTGSLLGVHASDATDWSTPVGNGSAESYSVNTWTVGDSFEFSTQVPGGTDLSIGVTVAFDQVSSGTGPAEFEFQYSMDGNIFAIGGSYTVLANTSPNNWSAGTPNPGTSYSFTIAPAVAILDPSPIYFRLVMTGTTSAGGGTVAAGGTSRVDNVSVTLVPEPTAAALGALGLLGLLRRRRA